MSQLVTEDTYEEHLTVARVAELAKVTTQDIRNWQRRGYIKAASRDSRKRPRYVLMDVLKAEARVRAKPQCHRVA